MSRLNLIAASAVIASCFVSPLSTAAVTAGAGWQATAVTAAPAGAFVGGMDFLPNGNLAIFDGAAIVEVNPSTGAVVGTIYTPAGPVFGSFVTVAPSGTFLLFGESSNQEITKVPLDGSPATLVTGVLFNYDLIFQSDDVAFLSAATGPFGTTDILRLDIPSGTTDTIAIVDGPSGPLAFGPNGDLFFGEGTISFPAPSGQQVVRKFTATQVDNAFGVGHLTTADSQVAITGVTLTHDMVIDEEGDLFISDSFDGFVRQYSQSGVLIGTVGQEAPFNAATSLALRGTDVAGRFDAFQPESAGTLAALSTDFFSFNDLNIITPKRPVLSVTPGNPIPDGPVTIALSDGPASGMALMLLSGAPTLSPEQHISANNASLFFTVNLGAAFIPFLAPLDANGGIAINATNGPTDAGSLTIQAIAVDSGGAPVGTTNGVSVVLQ